MKTTTNIRGKSSFHDSSEDKLRKATKLEPIKKNSKESKQFLKESDEDLDELDYKFKKRESVLDYFDDGNEDVEDEDDDLDSEDEDEDYDEDYDEDDDYEDDDEDERVS